MSTGMPSNAELAKAKQLHQDGMLAEAEDAYRAVLAADSECHEAHHMLGALLLQRHGLPEMNLVLDHLKTAVRLEPATAKYRHSLGKAHEAGEQWQAALDQYQHAVDKDPFTTLFQMSMVKPLTRLRRLTRVVEICRSVLALEPGHPKANFKCASALRQLRREAEALVHYRRHLKCHPDDEHAHFWIKVLSGEEVTQAPASHVASLFDFYAEHFEEHLVNSLKYCTPEALVGALHDAAADAAAGAPRGGRAGGEDWGCCVDLGCGTGLMGPLLRRHVSSLDGVDLSEKMVSKARDKACYDRLFVEDAVEFLQEQAGRGHSYDVLVAADVLVYIGDLAPLLKAAAGAANSGALLAVSTESADRDVLGESGYRATLTGRFQHSTAYVKETAVSCGWSLLRHSKARIRCNAGQPVTGDLFVFKS